MNSIQEFWNNYSSNIILSLIIFIVFTVLVLGALWLSDWTNRIVQRKQAADNQKKRFLNYGRLFLRVVLIYLIIGAALFFAKLWLGNYFDMIKENSSPALRFVTRQIVMIVIFVGMWELCFYFLRKKMLGKSKKPTQRMITLFPIIMNTAMIVFAVFYGFSFLSDININIAPLLTGAGVVGIAVGLGAQQTLKDVISGIAIIFEDLIQIGDVVRLGQHSGVVERITLRKVQLRDSNGAVYTVPYGEIKVVENLTKQFSFAILDISVDYSANIDQVFEIIKATIDSMKNDEKFSTVILEDIDIWGLDKFAENAVLIKARVKTLPSQQWSVQREYNHRLKKAFEKAGIDIPYPQRTIHLASDGALQKLSKQDA